MSAGSIWIYADHWQGKVSEVSKELLGQARRLAEQKGGTCVEAVVMGSHVEPLARELFEYGAETVYLAEHQALELYNCTVYAGVLEDLIRQYSPEILLFGSVELNEDLAATVAARLETGLSAHCIDLKWNQDGLLVQVVPAFGGKVLGDILCPEHRPQIATVKKGVFTKTSFEGHSGDIIQVPVRITDQLTSGLQTLEMVEVKTGEQSLEEAEVIIAGGWGIGGKAGWGLLEELAAELGGAVGCTRPALDEGWSAGEHTMIGTSGVTVTPKFYLGAGISGATHHMVGISGAGTIVSINKDPQAPVFVYSDYYVAMDYQDILPALIKKLKLLTG